MQPDSNSESVLVHCSHFINTRYLVSSTTSDHTSAVFFVECSITAAPSAFRSTFHTIYTRLVSEGKETHRCLLLSLLTSNRPVKAIQYRINRSHLIHKLAPRILMYSSITLALIVCSIILLLD